MQDFWVFYRFNEETKFIASDIQVIWKFGGCDL